MAIEHWSDEIIVVDLSEAADIGAELEKAEEFVFQTGRHDVVVDLANIEAVTSSNLSNLLRLRHLTSQRGRRLVLCNIEPSVEGVLSVTGLEEVFTTMCDRFAALATLEMIG